MFYVTAIVLRVWRLPPLNPLQRHGYCDAADIAEPSAAFSGNSRASHLAIVSIQQH